MSRYMKYMEIVNKMDELLGSAKGKKLLEGKVDPSNLAMLDKILCIQKQAFEMGRKIDFVDDMVKAMAKMSDSDNPESQGKVGRMAYGGGQSGGQPQGKDFRGGREDSGSESWAYGGSTTGFRSPSRGAYGYDEADDYGLMMPEHEDEENRRGVPGTGRYSRLRPRYRRYRSEMDNDGWDQEENRRGRSRRTGRFVHRADMDDEDMERNFWMLPGVGVPSWYGAYNRMGFGANPNENNRMYNNGGMSGTYNGVQLPVQGAGNGQAMNGVQVPVQSNGQGGNSGTSANTGTSTSTPATGTV